MRSDSRIIFLVLLLVAATIEFAATKAQWYTASDGNKYLIEGDQKFNWFQAVDECARSDLQLVTIDSAGKNVPLVALLLSVFGGVHNLWIGGHDEYNQNKDVKRPFYWLSTGKKISFSSWGAGEPDNNGGNEHCAHINVQGSAKTVHWNDRQCDRWSHGYICEEHYLTTKYKKDLSEKRKNTNEKNSQVSVSFEVKKDDIKKINQNAHQDTDKVLAQLKDFVEEITQTIGNINSNAENNITEVNKEFSKELNENQKKVDNILVW